MIYRQNLLFMLSSLGHINPVCVEIALALLSRPCTKDRVGALSHMNDLMPFKRTAEETTETMRLAPKQ